MRLNNKCPKEQASIFTQESGEVLSLCFSSLSSLPIFLQRISFSSLCVPSSLFLPISLFPQGLQLDPDAFVSRSLCHNFKQCRCSGHTDLPGASVTELSQVNVSQCVLDDTLSLSPISPLLISVVSCGGSAGS